MHVDPGGARMHAATSYLLGMPARRVEKLAASLGVTSLSKPQASLMAAKLDDMVEGLPQPQAGRRASPM
jgi:transposase-like protein